MMNNVCIGVCSKTYVFKCKILIINCKYCIIMQKYSTKTIDRDVQLVFSHKCVLGELVGHFVHLIRSLEFKSSSQSLSNYLQDLNRSRKVARDFSTSSIYSCRRERFPAVNLTTLLTVRCQFKNSIKQKLDNYCHPMKSSCIVPSDLIPTM